jgi:ribosomal protein L32
VQGNGYTNHCPNCLWSRHVDVNPGDRACACGGAMPPVSVESKGGEYIITHRCEVCGFERRNRSVAGDNFEALLDLARR